MNIVVITTLARPELLSQTLTSMEANSSDWKQHHLTIVKNGPDVASHRYFHSYRSDVTILCGNVGASAARNIGASSIPKYRRGDYVMFCDDDCYFAPHWDRALLDTVKWNPKSIVSGHGHPFNRAELTVGPLYQWESQVSILVRWGHSVPLVISTVNMLMPWSLWDDVGFFTEPGGAGGSEDYAFCMAAKEKGYGFAVSEPQVVLHCGITSSNGNPIVGQKEVMENNRKLEEIHGIQGRVVYL